MVAFDDTDSPDGMCTTYLATLVLEELAEYDLIGPPRLVRLNPNIPWKTRGNAAVCLPLGRGRGECHPCGELKHGPVGFYGRGDAADPRDLFRRTARVLESVAEFECDKTNPGLVVSGTRPTASLYWRAVREVVPMRDVEAALRGAGAIWKRYKNGRGIIGASAAMAWRPRDRTWEVISYRSPEMFGTDRAVDPRSVIRMDKATSWTFNNYDYDNGHVAIAPGSPCPILFGIRGDSPEELLKARKMIKGERPDKWLLFLTNQATEDHIVGKRIRSLSPGDSVKVRAKVAGAPRTVQGGHVVVPVSDGADIDAMFYEPSRGFRDVARGLVPGDVVTVYGSVRRSPRSLNVEKLHIGRLALHEVKAHNPLCAGCGKRMGSVGRGQGYRCKRCGGKAPPSAAEKVTVPRTVEVGWYEPPVSARRHLHKPLRRLSRGNINKI